MSAHDIRSAERPPFDTILQAMTDYVMDYDASQSKLAMETARYCLMDSLACGLMALGVQRGEKIAIWATNVPHWVPLMFAAANSRVDVMKALIAAGASVKAQTKVVNLAQLTSPEEEFFRQQFQQQQQQGGAPAAAAGGAAW